MSPINVAGLVAQALETAKAAGVATTVTITDRDASSFTITATREDPTPDAPPSVGSTSSAAPRFIMAAQGCDFVPAYGMTLSDGVTTFRILAVTPVKPGDADVLYIVEVAE